MAVLSRGCKPRMYYQSSHAQPFLELAAKFHSCVHVFTTLDFQRINNLLTSPIEIYDANKKRR